MTAATPLVRKLATQHGIALDQVHGTGTGGRITAADVTRAARARYTPPSGPTSDDLLALFAKADQWDRQESSATPGA